MAFFFADAGFDVWMNNSRGNKFSREHKYLDPDIDKEYWDFSFYELGKYDLPAVFDFILTKTSLNNLTYIGHSQGTSSLLVALCTNPDFFRDKINLAVFLAPVV